MTWWTTHRVLMVYQLGSVQFSHSVVSTLCDPMDCSTPSFPVHHQLPVYSNSCPLSRWCHTTISSSVVPFSSCLHSFPASGSFQMSQFFASDGQSIGASASASALPIFRTDFIEVWLTWSPCSPWKSQESSPTPQFKTINSLAFSFLYSPPLTSIHDHWKNHSFTRQTFVGKVISLLFKYAA